MDYCRTQIEAAVIIRIEEMSVVIIYLSTNYSLWSEQLGVDIINSSDIWKEKNPGLAVIEWPNYSRLKPIKFKISQKLANFTSTSSKSESLI